MSPHRVNSMLYWVNESRGLALPRVRGPLGLDGGGGGPIGGGDEAHCARGVPVSQQEVGAVPHRTHLAGGGAGEVPLHRTLTLTD
eukprot:1183056-Prorocentrum_minimum.AAC.2